LYKGLLGSLSITLKVNFSGSDNRIPCPPLLFNLVVDVLTRMLQKVGSGNLIEGLGNEIIEGRVISL
jgi:hypothetical protein